MFKRGFLEKLGTGVAAVQDLNPVGRALCFEAAAVLVGPGELLQREEMMEALGNFGGFF